MISNPLQLQVDVRGSVNRPQELLVSYGIFYKFHSCHMALQLNAYTIYPKFQNLS